ncbi:MAG: hypothetical protein ACFFDT_00310 [Candidatus Hodarchaeota archaeon]
MLLSKYLEINEKIVPESFWDEISIFTRYIIPVSGGVDSTVIALEFYKKGIAFELCWNDTRRSLKTARYTLSKLFQLGVPFYITYPKKKQREITLETKEAMKKIVSGSVKYDKNRIPCCRWLKEEPFKRFLKTHTDEETLIVSGIAGYEGNQRQWVVHKLRKNNTFLKFHKTKKRWFAYPLRDYTTQKQGKFLKNYTFNTEYKAVRSGCYTCPIVALFEEAIEEDMKRIERSKRVYIEGFT